MLEFKSVEFVQSAYAESQFPAEAHPEIAFAGRSNVGKSSLINRLVNRKGLVKVSARPGKTQSINFFLAENALYLVDLPGYGFARVPQAMKDHWRELIASYIEGRKTLKCVVVILDLRHPPKGHDLDLVAWLRSSGVPFLPVYTKADKLSRNEAFRQGAVLDAALGVARDHRVIFSAKTGEGREGLLKCLEQFLGQE